MEDIKSKLQKLGYRWFELEEEIDVAELIITILHSKDLRLIKAIPFIIYQGRNNSRARLDFDELGKLSVKNNLLTETIFLMYVSQQIFKKEKFLDLVAELDKYLENNLTPKERQEFKKNKTLFFKKLSFKIPDFKAFSEETYREFLTSLKLEKVEKKEYLQEEISKSKELDLRFALSFLFKKKQREIIKKIISEQPLTKTEYEYYIRIIKKRLEALIEIKELAETVLRKKAKRG